jgi:hypothetical protein
MAATCAGVWCILSQPSCRRQQLLLAARGQLMSCSNSRHLGTPVAATWQNTGPALAHTTRIPIHECPCPNRCVIQPSKLHGVTSCVAVTQGKLPPIMDTVASCHSCAMACMQWHADRVDETTITNTPGMGCTHLAHPSAHTPCRQTSCRRS